MHVIIAVVSLLLFRSSFGFEGSDSDSIQCYGFGCPAVSLPYEYAENARGIVCNGTESTSKDPKDCHQYYYCPPKDEESSENVTSVLFKCPQGYGFHPEWEVCVPEHFVQNCSGVFCPPYIYDGVIPDPKDCTFYYRCNYGFPMKHQCPRQTVFEPSTGVCKRFEGDEPECLKKPNVTMTTTPGPIIVSSTELPTTSPDSPK